MEENRYFARKEYPIRDSMISIEAIALNRVNQTINGIKRWRLKLKKNFLFANNARLDFQQNEKTFKATFLMQARNRYR